MMFSRLISLRKPSGPAFLSASQPVRLATSRLYQLPLVNPGESQLWGAGKREIPRLRT